MDILKTILVAWLCAFLALWPVVSYADDSPTPQEPTGVKEGEVVPFDGVLFPTVTAARLLADLEASEERCNARIDLAVAEAVNGKQLLLDTCNSNLAIRTDMYETRLQAHLEYTDFLEERMTKPKLSQEVTFILGIVAGVGITIGAGYAINEIATR